MKHLLALLLLAIFANLGSGQDLIERTRNGIKLENLDSPNVIAKSLKTLKANEVTNGLFSLNKQLKANAYSEYTDDAIYLDISTKTLGLITDKKNDYLQLAVPVTAERSFNLILEKVEVLSPTYKMETSSGKTIYPDRSQIMFYRGIIEGDAQSIAAVSIVHGKFRALLSDKDGNYIIGELPQEKGKFALYNDRTLKKSLGEYCKTDDSIHKIIKPNASKKSTDKSTISPCVPIYIEVAHQMYLDHGSSLSNVQAFLTSLMNEVATIYTNESITISLESSYVWDTTDPYTQINNNLGATLTQFGNRIMDNYDGRLAHLISTSGSQGGLAWVDVLYDSYTAYCVYDCPNSSYTGFAYPCDYDPNCCNFNPSCLSSTPVQEFGPYAVSTGLGTSVTAYPTFSWEVEVFAHEMGHNFGSPHTQSCFWNGNNTPIDGCVASESYQDPITGVIYSCTRPTPNCPPNGGTIMSYCHLNPCLDLRLSNGFGSQPGDTIRVRYNNPQNGITLECSEDDVPGCTDPNSCNYNASATVDDGSCDYSCFGCTDNTACNYDSGATMDDGSCDFSCYGCTNMMACNYDNTATLDDGSCEFSSCVGCMTDGSHNYDPTATMPATCETCTDNILNGDEVQIDCGGSLCDACPCTFAGNVVFNNQTLNSDNTTITSGNVISTNNTVTIQGNNTDVIWQSTQSIQLNPNFTINSGTLLINVEDCEEP